MGGVRWADNNFASGFTGTKAMSDKPRLALDDTFLSATMKMAGGNPGALRVCTEIMKYGIDIDPKGLGGFGALISMDSLGIYGSRIWLLYKDVCHESLVLMLACLRGWQLGLLPEYDLKAAIDGDRTRIDADVVLAMVKARLDSFDKSEPTTEPLETPPEVDRVIYMD